MSECLSLKSSGPPSLRTYWCFDLSSIPYRGFASIQTATTFCHSYFQTRSMARNDPLVIAAAALYLACKVEEQPKSVLTISEAIFSVAHRHKPKALEMLKNREFATKLKEKVLMAERCLLYVIGFDFEVEHPTQVALDFLQSNYNLLLPEEKRVQPETWIEECSAQAGPAFDIMNQLSGIAWNLCLVSYHMPNFLQHPPNHLAAAAIFVGAQIMGMTPTLCNGWHWFELKPLSIEFERLKEIVEQLLDVCERSEDKQLEVAPFKLQRQPGGGPLAARNSSSQ